MNERPILFSGSMVRAIIDGRKTQTRRVVKLPLKDRDFGCELAGNEIGQFEWNRLSPYGGTGDRLWVRETGWQRPERTRQMMREGADTWKRYYYDADGLTEADHEEFKAWGFKRRPSIHMPRRASRITLEITDVRVERLQDISEKDAKAEGAPVADIVTGRALLDQSGNQGSCKWGFELLWDSINAKRAPWVSNPWVWVVSFRRVTQ